MFSSFSPERLIQIYVEMDILAWFSMWMVALVLVGSAIVWAARHLARMLSRYLWERRVRRHNINRGMLDPLRRQ